MRRRTRDSEAAKIQKQDGRAPKGFVFAANWHLRLSCRKGQAVRERALGALASIRQPGSSEYWTDRAIEKRYFESHVDELRALGAPEWLLKVIPTLRALIVHVQRLRHRLRRPASD